MDRKRSSAHSSGNGSSKPLSREALRKANHSMIERRRREKINHAFSELRGMVPGLGGGGEGMKGEFKLEVSASELAGDEVQTRYGSDHSVALCRYWRRR